MNLTKRILSVKEVADLFGVSRIAVFQWIRSGKLPAEKVGRAYVISVQDLPHHLIAQLTEQKKDVVRRAVTKAMEDYAETFKRLAQE